MRIYMYTYVYVIIYVHMYIYTCTPPYSLNAERGKQHARVPHLLRRIPGVEREILYHSDDGTTGLSSPDT